MIVQDCEYIKTHLIVFFEMMSFLKHGLYRTTQKSPLCVLLLEAHYC